MTDFKKYLVRCEIHVEVEMTASTAWIAQKTVTAGLTKILTEHRLELNEITYHDVKVEIKKED
jgi:hypothetical protein